MFGNFQVNIMCNSFIVKQFFVLFEIKIWDSTYEEFSNDLFSSSPVNENMSRFYNKDIEILVALLLELKMFELVHLYNFGDHGSSHRELFYKKGFVNIFAKFTGNSHLSAGVCFLKKNWLRVKKKALAQVFSHEFCEIYQNTNFKEYLRTAAITRKFSGGVPL